jgi:hypothetical protein
MPYTFGAISFRPLNHNCAVCRAERERHVDAYMADAPFAQVPFGDGVIFVSPLEPGGDPVGQFSWLSGKRSCVDEWRAACNAAHLRITLFGTRGSIPAIAAFGD